MLNFRNELGKIVQDKKDEFQNQEIITNCLKALLSEFRKMKTVQSKTFLFRIDGNKKLKVEDGDNKIIFEQDFQNDEKAKKIMAQIKKYFKEQNYKVEDFYFQKECFCLEIEI